MGWKRGFSVFWKVKTMMSSWGFEGTFSVMLWTTDWGEKLLGHLKNKRRQKSFALLFSNFGPKDSVLLFW